eukprot:4385482-Prymnesium_polylepis.1
MAPLPPSTATTRSSAVAPPLPASAATQQACSTQRPAARSSASVHTGVTPSTDHSTSRPSG